jgi:hypothetical protein
MEDSKPLESNIRSTCHKLSRILIEKKILINVFTSLTNGTCAKTKKDALVSCQQNFFN